MKASLLALSLLSLVLRPTLALPADDTQTPEQDTKVESQGGQSGGEESYESYTTFNGIKVPSMAELEGHKFDEEIKEGYWFVKHYSPYCHHCIAIAPTWQTLYEFYYTSDPLSTSTSKQAPNSQSNLNSFHRYYNFHFANMDCIAYSDKCQAMGIRAFPTFALYHNGKLVELFKGKKDMAGLSEFLEEKLEAIKPGSRPLEGLKLPEPGAKEFDTKAAPDKPAVKDKKPAAGSKDGKNVPAKTAPPKKPQEDKTRPAPNPQGTSIPLTAESFQTLVTTTQDPWFIKFYVPWCHHCQALAPTWGQMAKDMKGQLNIGEVNCQTEARLCKDARVNMYPTMYFFRGGERVEYDGLRGLGDLVNYAKKAIDVVGSGVQYVDAAAFKEMEETEEVIFLYFFDHATTSEDFAALDRLTLSLVGHARLVTTNDTALAERFKISTWPRLLVSRDGRASYYTALAPKDMRDFRQVLTWMQRVWLPIVPELTPSNAREIMEGKFVVLGILNRLRSDEFILDKKELKNAALEWMDKQTKLFQLERQEMRDAKELRIEEADDRNDQRALRAAKSTHITIREDDKKQVGFAWVDGIFWDRWVKTTFNIDVKRGERVVINDEENRRYWDQSLSGNYIMPSRTSILETLTQIVQNPPKIRAKSTVGFFEGAVFMTRSFTAAHPIITLALVAFCISFSTLWVRGRIRKNKGSGAGGILGIGGGNSGQGFFHLDGKEGLLSGGGGQGKVD